jgi:hypothetical protein
LGFGQAVNAPAPAATDNAPAPTLTASASDQAQVMEKFTVTGSNIANADEALAIPVSVVSPGDIKTAALRPTSWTSCARSRPRLRASEAKTRPSPPPTTMAAPP